MEWLARQTVRAQTVAKLRRRAGSRPDLADFVEWVECHHVVEVGRLLKQLGAMEKDVLAGLPDLAVRLRPPCSCSRSG